MSQRRLVRTYVRPDLIDAFQKQFPQPGATSWLLELALTEMLALTDGQPDLNELAGSAIRTAILRDRHANTPDPNGPKHPLTLERID